MEQKDDKKAGIPIPTLKDTLRPQLKIKGLQAGQSLVERLKQFKKKDLAFILAGLGVLFMAPLAEHFLMSPDSAESGAFKEGWGFKPGAGGLGAGGSPFEGGLNGLAPGGAAGGGSDVITPLNVRDPSALVMGPGATQQPPATQAASAPAPAPAPSSGSSDWKDALSQSAATAAKKAAPRAALPVPKVPLSNGGLRGLGVAAGGGGGTFSVGAVPGAQFGKGGGGDSTGLIRGGKGITAATRGAGSPNAGGFEQLKKQAGAQASDISRAGSAVANLEQAAGRNMGSGTNGDGGGGAAGANDKAAAGNQDKGSKTTGESLEFLRLKAEQDKAIELKWDMIKKKAMFPLELQQEITKTLIMEPIKEIAKFPGKLFGGVPGSAAGSDKYVCTTPANEFPRADVDANGACKMAEGRVDNQPCFANSAKTAIMALGQRHEGCSLQAGTANTNNGGNVEESPNAVPIPGSAPCTPSGGTANSGVWHSDPTRPNAAPICKAVGETPSATSANLATACTEIAEFMRTDSSHTSFTTTKGHIQQTVTPALRKLASGLKLMDESRAADSCGDASLPVTEMGGKRSVKTQLAQAAVRGEAGFKALQDGTDALSKNVLLPLAKKALGESDVTSGSIVKGIPDAITARSKTNATAEIAKVTAVLPSLQSQLDAAAAKFTDAGVPLTGSPAVALTTPGKPFADAKNLVGAAGTNLGTVKSTYDGNAADLEQSMTLLTQDKALFTEGTAGADTAKKLDNWVKAIREAKGDHETTYTDLEQRQGAMNTVLANQTQSNGVLLRSVEEARLASQWVTDRSVESVTPATTPARRLTTSVKQFTDQTTAKFNDLADCPNDCAGSDNAAMKAKWDAVTPPGGAQKYDPQPYKDASMALTQEMTLVNNAARANAENFKNAGTPPQSYQPASVAEGSTAAATSGKVEPRPIAGGAAE